MSGAAPRPRVLVNFAASLDGKISPPPAIRRGPFTMSRYREDHRRMRVVRERADAILIGASNLRLDDPDLAISSAERARRRAAGEPEPWRVVVTSRGEGVIPTLRMFDPARGGRSVVAHSGRMAAEHRARLAPVAELIELGAEAVAIDDLLGWLWRGGIRTLLCEGGGELCAQVFAARAVDELYLTLVPRVLGGATAPTLAGGPGFAIDELPDATLADLERIGDELFLRYTFKWEAVQEKTS